MNRHGWAGVCTALALLTIAPAATGQHDYTELNLHAGVLLADRDAIVELSDDIETDPMFGIRLARHTESGWGVGGNFDWVSGGTLEAGSPDLSGIDLDMFLYSAEIGYTFPTPGPLDYFVGAGAGGATERLKKIPPLDEDETNTDLLVPLVAGLKIYDNDTVPRWAFRLDVRDNLIWREEFSLAANDVSSGDTSIEHNWEISAGVSFFLGRRSEPRMPPDSDLDGVFDDRDRCPGTPLGVRVDPIGCAIPIDSDSDGVPDDRDSCPGTPMSEDVDAQGCTVEPEPEPEPAVACADGRGWFRFNDTISFDGRNWVKFGAGTTIAADQLVQIGEFDGLPVYAGRDAEAPVTTMFVPLCADPDSYHPYQVEQEVRGTTG